ncbi:MAG: exodeoxyribonuclease VII large subunit [Acidobacteria bacterium]|nr:exodeoxyribonuclease VII large subunit [Acidobacteriota bacterium]
MSSRFPGRVYPLRGGAPRRVAETQLSLGDAGPESTAMTVSQVIAEINGMLRTGFPNVWVRGEVSGFRGPAASGHCFFSLKDESGSATLRVKVFASDFRRIPFTLEEGLLVLARGTPDIYPERGELSLRIVEIQPSGIGALQLAFEQLKARLAAEGLFDAAKKRPLPLLPRRIGVVTSRHGAALRDILKVLDARFPNAHVTLYPASVQGAAAPGEIVRAVRAFSRVAGSADVVIVARGGGSKEDLAAFNDESVVRAVAASRVPVICAVGHETDVSLAELAADVRAATPSQAAEIVVGPLAQFEERLARGKRDLRISLKGRMERATHRLARLASAPAFAGFPATVSEGRLDSRAASAALFSSFQRIPSSLLSLVSRLEQSVRAWADRAAFPLLLGRVAAERRAAADRMAARVASANESLGVAVAQLEALSPLRVLARGYAIVTKEGEASPVTDAAALTPGNGVRIRLARGRAVARILSTETE